MTLVQRTRDALAASQKLPDTPLVRRLLMASTEVRREQVRGATSKYVPHQGARECARRCRRMARAAGSAEADAAR